MMPAARHQARRRSTTAGVAVSLLLAAGSAGIASVGSTPKHPVSPSASGAPAVSTVAGGPLPQVFVRPDSQLHPGLVDPAVTAKTLCAPGYSTTSVRPPVSYTNKLKQLELGDGGTIVAPSG